MRPPGSQPLPIRTALHLGDIAKVFAGVGVSREESVKHPGEKLPVLGVRDLQDGGIAPKEALDTVGFDTPSRANPYAVEGGDVLMTGRGTLLKFGLVGVETEGAIASANIIVVRPGPAVVGGALFALLSSDAYRPKIEMLRRGATTLLSLSPRDVANLELTLPPLAEQRRIAALVMEAQEAYRSALQAAEIRRALARKIVAQRLLGNLQHEDENGQAK